jgi:hypothetical protein
MAKATELGPLLLPVPDEVRAKMEALVERYRHNADQYQGSAYNEAQCRQDFIDPFFEALGWDVRNTAGYAEQYRDVVQEPTLKTEEATRAPDYCFRIGGTRKFYVEAKKPSVRLHEDVGPAYQVRRYAWSAKLPLSILTDFEEFAVYDCGKGPAPQDKASVGRVRFLTYRQYLDELEYLYSTFSREAILKGSFDRYAEDRRRHRGTAEVDAAFLAEIEGWRDALARDIANHNKGLSVDELNFAVQATIDRILFFRIAEDRGVEEEGRLRAIADASRGTGVPPVKGPPGAAPPATKRASTGETPVPHGSIYRNLCRLYREADAKYNSGLFDFGKGGDALSPRLAVSDKVLRPILKGLYYPQCPCEFSVIGADILGAVYEQFLGKVIRLTPSGMAKVEEKPEVKKAGGVYYTPTYIVDYIVKHTVEEAANGAGKPEKVAKLRVLDPACGSGSFLLGAYECLLQWHLRYYVEHGAAKHARGKDPVLVQVGERDWRLSTAERKRILLNNLYGVDIDRQAVEVTKLNLLLKCMEGDVWPGLVRDRKLIHDRVLPNIDGNIKCGNSLIGPDYFSGHLVIDPEEERRVNPFDWPKEFPAIMQAGGFDCVIGNPPYVPVTADLFTPGEATYLLQRPVSQYKADVFHLFIQRGIELLRRRGRFGYIVPNPWFTQQFTDRLRRYVLSNSAIDEVVVFEHLVFQAATVYTGLLLLTVGPPKHSHRVRVRRPPDVASPSEIEGTPCDLVPQVDWASAEGCVFETRLCGAVGSLVKRLTAQWPRLDDVARASLGCQAYNSTKHTPAQIRDRVFHADTCKGPEYLPELAGNDVGRYVLDRKRGQWIRYGPWLHDYRTMDWLGGPRVLLREITAAPPYCICGTYVEDTYCHYKTILNVNPSGVTRVSMKYLTGLLNSRLLSFLYPLVSNKMVARGFPRLSVGDVKRLPIRPIDFSEPSDVARHDRMVGLVERMLDLHRRLPDAKTKHDRELIERRIQATDDEIDRLVYELYGLTEEEIAIVEGE